MILMSLKTHRCYIRYSDNILASCSLEKEEKISLTIQNIRKTITCKYFQKTYVNFTDYFICYLMNILNYTTRINYSKMIRPARGIFCTYRQNLYYSHAQNMEDCVAASEPLHEISNNVAV